VAGALLAWSVAASAAGADALGPNGQAWTSFRARDFATAEAASRQAWAAASSGANALQAGVGAANLAAALAIRGRFAEALEWSGKAEERLVAAGARKPRGRLLAARALMHYADGARGEGAKAFTQAEAWLDKDDWPLAFARLTVGLYVDPSSQKSYEGLRVLLKRAREGQNREQTLRALLALGWAETFFDPETSVAHYREAQDLAAAGGDAELRAYAAHDLGVAHFRRGELGPAEAAFREGLDGVRASGDRQLQVVLHDDLSLLHAQKGDEARAREEDVSGQRVLAQLAEDLRSGRIEDTVLLDFRQLSKTGYLNLPGVRFPLFHGVFDQLALDPAAEP
jgi:tetratricopeptide (TPR) repeat protein